MLESTSFVLCQSFWGEMGPVGDSEGPGPQGPLGAPAPAFKTPQGQRGVGMVPDGPLSWGCQARALWGDCVNGGEERAAEPRRFALTEREPHRFSSQSLLKLLKPLVW